MCRICFDRIIPDHYQPARAQAIQVVEDTFLAPARAMVEARGWRGKSELNADDVILKAKMALPIFKKWPNGKTLRCVFLDGETSWQQNVITKAKTWEEHANIRFEFIDSGDAEIRISFVADAGSWSAVGTDALIESYFPKYQPTMNFGWLRGDTPDNEYQRVVIHEFGHALGCIHEHQSPAARLAWDRAAVYRYFSGPPNYWKKEDIDRNVLQKYSAENMSFTPFDDDSIMLYQFPAELFTDHKPTPTNISLSEKDKKMIATLYPK